MQADPNDPAQAIFDPNIVRRNGAAINHIRSFGSVLSGALAGIIGLTGVNGFALYIVFSAILSVLLRGHCGTDVSLYFASPWSVYTDGILGGLFTYLLFWTLVYGMVHIY
mmetsp:Transcript_4060/g.10233  ORF Transcript_4060/g.10233 Transcript_4060/m.10233 type:complete len:110 (+) Transcript_4060:99-428(+)